MMWQARLTPSKVCADYVVSHDVTVSEESYFSNNLLVQPLVAYNAMSFLQTHSVLHATVPRDSDMQSHCILAYFKTDTE